jgi:hypothetical protein
MRDRTSTCFIATSVVLAAFARTAESHTLNGYRWPGDKPRIPVQLSVTFETGAGMLYDGTFEDAQLALDSVIAEWHESPYGKSEARIVRLGNTSVTDVADDGINAVIIKDGVCPYGGVCTAAIIYHLAPDGVTMRGFDIVLYTIRADGIPAHYSVYGALGNETHLGTVLGHELGHAMGLGHSGAGGMMTPGGFGWIASVVKDDIDGLKALYGPYTNDGFFVPDETPALGEVVPFTLDYPSSPGAAYAVFSSLALGGGLTLHAHFAYPPCGKFLGDSRFFPLAGPLYSASDFGGLASGFVGTLDAFGRASPTVGLPPVPALAAVPLHFAAIVYQPFSDGPPHCKPFDSVAELGESLTIQFHP